jgi:hypothetical protein
MSDVNKNNTEEPINEENLSEEERIKREKKKRKDEEKAAKMAKLKAKQEKAAALAPKQPAQKKEAEQVRKTLFSKSSLSVSQPKKKEGDEPFVNTTPAGEKKGNAFYKKRFLLI